MRCYGLQEDTEDTVLCLLAPYPWFQPFHRATEVLAHLLLAPEESMLTVGEAPPTPCVAVLYTTTRVWLSAIAPFQIRGRVYVYVYVYSHVGL